MVAGLMSPGVRTGTLEGTSCSTVAVFDEFMATAQHVTGLKSDEESKVELWHVDVTE